MKSIGKVYEISWSERPKLFEACRDHGFQTQENPGYWAIYYGSYQASEQPIGILVNATNHVLTFPEKKERAKELEKLLKEL